MKDRIAKSVFWLVWSRGVIQAISFATTLVVARFLSPSDYGLMALAAVWTGILGTVSSLGLGAAVVQFRDLEEGELNFCFFLANSMAWLTYGALYAAAPAIAAWFDSPDLSAVLRVVGLLMPVGALNSVHGALMEKRLQFDWVAKADILGAVVTIPVMFVMAYRGMGVWALVTAALCKPAVSALVIFWYSRWIPAFTCKMSRARSILSYSVASFGSRSLWATYDQADAFVLGKIAGETALGFYTMGRDLASLVPVKISTIVNQLSVPIMAELQDDRRAMREALLRGIRLVASASFPLCIGLMLVAEDAVRLALTEKWLPIVPIMQILCLSALIKSIEVLLPPILRARFRAGFLAGYNTVLVVLIPPMFLLGALWAGGVGVAVVWVTGYPILMTWMARTAMREIDLGWLTLLDQLRMPALAALAMSVVVLGVQHLVPGMSVAVSWIRLGAAVMAGALVYCAILWFWGGRLSLELREMALWVFRPRKDAATR